MGKKAGKLMKNRQVTPLGDPKEKLANRGVMTYGAPPSGPPTIHALVCALDYKQTSNALTCTVDGNNFRNLLQSAGVQHVEVMYDNQCTKPAMLAAIQNVCRQVGPEDTFLFFYAGHGTSVTDTDGDEEDHKDEAYVCVTAAGQLDLQNSLLTDDEFSAAVCSSLNPTATMINVSDCCHSGSICDFKRESWNGRKAVSIAGCRDTQTSGDTGNGGICTHAMLLAIESLQKKGKQSYSIQEFFAEVLSQDASTFASPQDITIDSTKNAAVAQMPWPLIPGAGYTAPYHGGGAAGGSVSAPVAGGSASVPAAQYVQPQAQYVQPQAQFTSGAQYTTAPPQYVTAPPKYVSAQPQAQYVTAQPQAQYVTAPPQAQYVTTQQPQYTTGGQYTSAQPQYVTAQPQYVSAQPQYVSAQPQQYVTGGQYAGGYQPQVQTYASAAGVQTQQYVPSEPQGQYYTVA